MSKQIETVGQLQEVLMRFAMIGISGALQLAEMDETDPVRKKAFADARAAIRPAAEAELAAANAFLADYNKRHPVKIDVANPSATKETP